MKAIRFNPIDENELTFNLIESSFKVIDEFYFQTDKGPLLQGIVWKDTDKNREIIASILNAKRELQSTKNRIQKEIMIRLHDKEK